MTDNRIAGAVLCYLVIAVGLFITGCVQAYCRQIRSGILPGPFETVAKYGLVMLYATIPCGLIAFLYIGVKMAVTGVI